MKLENDAGWAVVMGRFWDPRGLFLLSQLLLMPVSSPPRSQPSAREHRWRHAPSSSQADAPEGKVGRRLLKLPPLRSYYRVQLLKVLPEPP